MADIVNLNKIRKQKARELKDNLAAENRVRFGRTKAEKARDAAEAADARRKLDLLKREPGADPQVEPAHEPEKE